MKPAGQLTFQWPEKGFTPLFAGFLLLSVLIHVFGFYLFQIVYPPSGSINPPPAQIVVVDMESPDARIFAGWMAAEDPEVIANPVAVEPSELLDVKYRPTYDRSATSFKSPPMPEATTTYPAGRSAAEILRKEMAFEAPVQQPVRAPGTHVVFSGALADRHPAQLPQISRMADLDYTFPSTTYLTGLTSSGEPCYFFLQTSSGDAELDEQARSGLSEVKFQPDEQAQVAWGMATVYWGNDEPAPQTPTASTPPPSTEHP